MADDFRVGHKVAILRKGVRGNDEWSATIWIKGNLLETWCREHIAVCGWTDGIKTYRRENVPSRHLTCIVVARESAGSVIILCIKNMGHTFDSLFSFPDEIVQIGNLVTRFVAVPITSFSKHGIEFRLELLRPSQYLPHIVVCGNDCDAVGFLL